MARNTSRKRARPFVEPSARRAHERPAQAPKAAAPQSSLEASTDRLINNLRADAPKSASRGLSGRGKLALVGGGTAAVGGGAYLVHRHQRSKTMSKNLIDPFSEVVAFGKAYPVAVPVPGSVHIATLIPTGRHVGSANNLLRVRNSGGGGGPATALERYTTKVKGHRQGPFSKGSVANGLRMAASQKGVIPVKNPNAITPTGLGTLGSRTFPAKLRRAANSNIPDGARAGRRLS